MRKTLLLLLAAGLFAVMPALAVEPPDMETAGEHVQRCVLQSEAIGKKIERLQSEIKKGKTKYSAEELRKLEATLAEANAMLDSIASP